MPGNAAVRGNSLPLCQVPTPSDKAGSGHAAVALGAVSELRRAVWCHVDHRLAGFGRNGSWATVVIMLQWRQKAEAVRLRTSTLLRAHVHEA